MSDHVRISKFLSLVLRHQPEAIGLKLDANGWINVDELIQRANAEGKKLTRPLLEEVVAENDKKRFAFSEDGQRIRASQGHSIDVDLAITPREPPEFLYHGTATRFIEAIREHGLKSMSRQHVHLSADRETAVKVGQRHGKPYVLTIRSQDMANAGHKFWLSANGVWLSEPVPTAYINFTDE